MLILSNDRSWGMPSDDLKREQLDDPDDGSAEKPKNSTLNHDTLHLIVGNGRVTVKVPLRPRELPGSLGA